jgi:hypothetical protein
MAVLGLLLSCVISASTCSQAFLGATIRGGAELYR